MRSPDRQKLLTELQTLIRGTKSQIVPAVHSAVRAHISSKTLSECLTIVARNKAGRITQRYAPNPPGPEYLKALLAFIRKTKFRGSTLDSALSDSTAKVVADIFTKKIKRISGKISATTIKFLVSDKKFSTSIAATIMQSHKSVIPAHLKSQITSALGAQIQHALAQQSSVAAIKTTIAKGISVAIASPLGHKIAVIAVKMIIYNLQPIILKILASAAFKAAIASKIQAIIVTSVVGGLAQLLAAKLGLTMSTIFAWAFIPILLAWMAHEAWTFPQKLASKLADEITADLQKNFEKTSSVLSDKLANMLLVEGIALLTEQILSNDKVVSISKRLAKAA